MSAARTPVRSLPTRQKKSRGSPASAASVMTWHMTDINKESDMTLNGSTGVEGSKNTEKGGRGGQVRRWGLDWRGGAEGR